MSYSVVMLCLDRRIDRRILDQAACLVSAGFRVSIIAGSKPVNEDDCSERFYPELEVVRIDPVRSEALAAKTDVSSLRGFIERLPRYDWQQIFPEFIHYVLEAFQRPAAVYVAHDLPTLPAALLISQRYGSKLIYDSHELFPEQFADKTKRDLYSNIERELIGFASAVMTVNQSIADEMHSRYGIARPHVILNLPAVRGRSLPLRRHNYFREKLGISARQKVLLFQGNMGPKTRNLEPLVTAASDLPRDDYALVLMGEDHGVVDELISIAGSQYEKKIFIMPAVPQHLLLDFTASADAGIVPYRGQDLNTQLCTPNKLFEFIVCGLPILANDLPELRRFVAGNGIGLNMSFDSVQQIRAAIDALLDSDLQKFRATSTALSSRFVWEAQAPQVVDIYRRALDLRTSRTEGETTTMYENHGEMASNLVREAMDHGHLRRSSAPRRNVLIVINYPTREPMRRAVSNHIYGFSECEGVNVSYLNTYYTDGIPPDFFTTPYDLIIFHTAFLSARWDLPEFRKLLANPLVQYLKKIPAVKAALPQDEFIHSDALCEMFEEFQVSKIFSVMPEREWRKMYGSLGEKVSIFPFLTAYLDHQGVEIAQRFCTDERPIDIGYRAWRASFWLGRHGLLKVRIGEVFKERAAAAGFTTDISLDDSATIVGDDWYRFLAKCKFQIGVEGGASILDRDGTIKERTEHYLKSHPHASFEMSEAACFPGVDGNFLGVGVTPRHLECSLFKTAQILVEGEYNGMFLPDVHYIPVKKDFSNMNDVFQKMRDPELRRSLVQRCYEDIVSSDRYSYRQAAQFLFSKSLDL